MTSSSESSMTEELTPQEPLLTSKQKRGLVVIAFAFVVYVGGFQAFNVVISSMLTKEGSDVGSSFQTISTITAFCGYFVAFVTTGSTTMIGKHHSKGEYSELGRVLESALAVALIAGGIMSLILGLTYEYVVEVFDPNNELLAVTPEVVMYVGAFFWLTTLGSAVTGIFFGLGMFMALAVVGTVSGATYAGLFVGLYQSGLGLVSFAVGTAVSKFIFAFGGIGWIYWSSHRREKFQLQGCMKLPRISSEFSGAISYLSVRSLFSNVRFLIMVIFTVRLGTVEGATYLILDKLTGVTYSLTRALGFVIGAIGTRLFGRGQHRIEQEDKERASAMGSVWALGTVCTSFALFWGIGLASAYGSQGRDILFSRVNETELEEYDQVFTQTTFVLFILNQPFHAISSLYELFLISAHDYKFVGGMIGVFFIVAYLPVLLYGYYVTKKYETVYMAETVYMGARAISCLIRWHFMLSPKYSPADSKFACCALQYLPKQMRHIIIDIRDSFGDGHMMLKADEESQGEMNRQDSDSKVSLPLDEAIDVKEMDIQDPSSKGSAVAEEDADVQFDKDGNVIKA